MIFTVFIGGEEEIILKKKRFLSSLIAHLSAVILRELLCERFGGREIHKSKVKQIFLLRQAPDLKPDDKIQEKSGQEQGKLVIIQKILNLFPSLQLPQEGGGGAPAHSSSARALSLSCLMIWFIR